MKRITVLIASALCLIACNNEVNFVVPEIETEKGQITLYLPDATMHTYSAADVNECIIERLWIVEFNSAGNRVNDTLLYLNSILGNGSNVQLLPQLPFEPKEGNTVVFIANSDVWQWPHPNRSSINYSNINTYFPLLLQVFYYGESHLPMYGEIKSWPGTYSCEMVREVAKIQVQMGAAAIDVTGSFNPENVGFKVMDMGEGGYIQPQATILGIPLPYGIPHAGNPTFNARLLQKTNMQEGEKAIYLHEYPSSNKTGEAASLGAKVGADVLDTVFNSRRRSIVLRKNDGVNPATYYRMDFYDPVTKKFIDTKRNHHYIFTIHRIGSEGYPSEIDALDYPGSNIEYTVEIRDGANHVTSNGQYAIVTSVDTAYVKADTANAVIATARYQLPDEMTALTTLINEITLTDVFPLATSMTLVAPLIPPNNKLTTVNIPIVVNTTGFDSARVKMKVGNIVHYIVVKKKP
jgi:hypothetical protein